MEYDFEDYTYDRIYSTFYRGTSIAELPIINEIRPLKIRKISQDIYTMERLFSLDTDELYCLTGHYYFDDFMDYFETQWNCPDNNNFNLTHYYDIDNVLFYINPYNGAVYWFCRLCYDSGRKGHDCWHYLPSEKRQRSTAQTDGEMLLFIENNKSLNVKQIANKLDWTYGKAYKCIQRLSKANKIKLDTIEVDGHKEMIVI